MDRRQDDKIHRAQLWWSCFVALALAAAALVHLDSPKNALMEPDRGPAQIRPELARDSR